MPPDERIFFFHLAESGKIIRILHSLILSFTFSSTYELWRAFIQFKIDIFWPLSTWIRFMYDKVLLSEVWENVMQIVNNLLFASRSIKTPCKMKVEKITTLCFFLISTCLFSFHIPLRLVAKLLQLKSHAKQKHNTTRLNDR